MVGTDRTTSMTGKHNGCIYKFGKVAQLIISMGSMLNELPLRHVCIMLDGNSKSPNSFSGQSKTHLEETF